MRQTLSFMTTPGLADIALCGSRWNADSFIERHAPAAIICARFHHLRKGAAMKYISRSQLADRFRYVLKHAPPQSRPSRADVRAAIAAWERKQRLEAIAVVILFVISVGVALFVGLRFMHGD